ncbi:MAG: hypothetical protein IT170_02575 [Bryobacterales bacterium]|nr:hypothetical protein [Bryobacterales bacterium]
MKRASGSVNEAFGFVDYPRLFALLNKIGYNGYLVFEIGGDPDKMEGYLRDGKRRIEALLKDASD